MSQHIKMLHCYITLCHMLVTCLKLLYNILNNCSYYKLIIILCNNYTYDIIINVCTNAVKMLLDNILYIILK